MRGTAKINSPCHFHFCPCSPATPRPTLSQRKAFWGLPLAPRYTMLATTLRSASRLRTCTSSPNSVVVLCVSPPCFFHNSVARRFPRQQPLVFLRGHFCRYPRRNLIVHFFSSQSKQQQQQQSSWSSWFSRGSRLHRLGMFLRYTRIPLLVISVYSLGYQQGLIGECALRERERKVTLG